MIYIGKIEYLINDVIISYSVHSMHESDPGIELPHTESLSYSTGLLYTIVYTWQLTYTGMSLLMIVNSFNELK